MLLSVLAWDNTQRETVESKLRSELCIHNQRSADALGKVYQLPSTISSRASCSLLWALEEHDLLVDDRFMFTTLMPAYTLADAADTSDYEHQSALQRLGKGDQRLIALQCVWEKLQPIDAAIVIQRFLGNGEVTDETLVDAARDLAKNVLVYTQNQIWHSDFGREVVKQLIELKHNSLFVEVLGLTRKPPKKRGKKR